MKLKPVIIKSETPEADDKYTFCHRRGLAVCSLYVGKETGSAWIANLEVEEGHRRRGLGSAMLACAVAHAAALGVRAVCLTVAAHELIPFYTRAGFERYGREIGGCPVMRKTLMP